MPAKTKTPQKENLTEAHGRDLFQTPNYAVDLLVPFLKGIGVKDVWECAAGLGKITRRLTHHGFKVISTDISYSKDGGYFNFLTDSKDGGYFNFLTDNMTWFSKNMAIVTNTPFSLKKKFFHRCLQYKTPFALLIPADYSGWIIEACQNGAEKIIPTRRIDYITPNVLKRIHEGETWDMYVYKHTQSMNDFKKRNPLGWNQMLNESSDEFLFNSIYDAPAKLLRKYSSSDFHSMWLTMGFNIGKQETFVELTNEEKDNI